MGLAFRAFGSRVSLPPSHNYLTVGYDKLSRNQNLRFR